MKKLLKILPLVILFCFTPGCHQGEDVSEQTMANIKDEKVKA